MRRFSGNLKPPASRAKLAWHRESARWQEFLTRQGSVRNLLQMYDWKGALKTCRDVLKEDPDHLGALEIMAQAQWFGGQFRAVIKTTSRLLRLNPHEPGYRYTRGMANMSEGNLLLAAQDFRYAIAQSKDMRFQAQVASSLEAVELWLEERSPLSHQGLPQEAILPARRPAPFGLASRIH